MADATTPIVAAPRPPGAPYDATAPDGDSLSGWVKLNSGPCDMAGNVTGDWPSDDGWKQT